jgi:hypothetical protein
MGTARDYHIYQEGLDINGDVNFIMMFCRPIPANRKSGHGSLTYTQVWAATIAKTLFNRDFFARFENDN